MVEVEANHRVIPGASVSMVEASIEVEFATAVTRVVDSQGTRGFAHPPPPTVATVASFVVAGSDVVAKVASDFIDSTVSDNTDKVEFNTVTTSTK